MRIFKGKVGFIWHESEFDLEFEVEDNATEEQIALEAQQAALESIHWHYAEVDAAKVQGGE